MTQIQTFTAEQVGAVMQTASTELAALLAKRATERPSIPIVNGKMEPGDYDALLRLARGLVRSGLVPKGLEVGTNNNEEMLIGRVAICIAAGMRLGQDAIWSLSNVMIVNNRPCVFGDAIPGLLFASGKVASVADAVVGTGDERGHVHTLARVGVPGTFVGRFSVADAKRAGLWGKAGPWTNYPDRMLKVRARAFAARDGFADVLQGLGIAEEQLDVVGEIEAVAPRQSPQAAAVNAIKAASVGAVASAPVEQAATPEPAPQVAPTDGTNGGPEAGNGAAAPPALTADQRAFVASMEPAQPAAPAPWET